MLGWRVLEVGAAIAATLFLCGVALIGLAVIWALIVGWTRKTNA